jgi:hypothetical protein
MWAVTVFAEHTLWIAWNTARFVHQRQLVAIAKRPRRSERTTGLGLLKDRFRPILLKKSTMVSSAEKYASGIEIFTFGRGFRTEISRSSVQKKAFSLVNDQADWADRLFSTESSDSCPS